MNNIEKDQAGHRAYLQENLDFLKIVRCMRNTGMGIASIKDCVQLCSQGDDTLLVRQRLFREQKGPDRAVGKALLA